MVLRGLKDRYEAFHRVRITDEAIVAAAELSDRYISDRSCRTRRSTSSTRPRRASGCARKTKPVDTKAMEEEIGRLERERDQAVGAEDYDQGERAEDDPGGEAGRAVRAESATGRQRAPEVTVEDIAEVVSRATGSRSRSSPQEERDRLLKLEEQLHERVVGPGRGRGSGRRGRSPRPGGSRRPEASRSGASCSSGRRVSARPSSRGRWPRCCSATRTDDPVRHERVPGAAHREPAGRRAARVRRLRGGRPAHRGGPAQAVLGGPARRDREGAPRRVQPPAADPGRRTAHRRPGPHRRLQEHRRDHDEQPRRRTDPGARPAARRTSRS